VLPIPPTSPASDAAPCAFGLCDGSGFVIDDASNTASDCRCRPQRLSRARARSLEAVVPRRYRGVSFDRAPVTEMPEPVVTEVRRYVRHVEQRLDEWLVGDVGTGKTTLAMIISRAALDAGRTVAIYSLPRLLNLIRQAIDSEQGMLDYLDRLSAVDLLHIDDLGAEKTTEWVLEQLYSIVNARYEAQRAIVATTNLMPDALAAQIGERTVSRLEEMCGHPLALFGEDRRVQVRHGGAETRPFGGERPGGDLGGDSAAAAHDADSVSLGANASTV
jgi:DNA replication protein DnaC